MEIQRLVDRQIQPARWLIVVWWTLACLLGWAAGLALGELFTFVSSRLGGVNEDRAFFYLALLSTGLTVGLVQWWLIRAYLPAARRWVPATLAGFLLALLVFAGSNRIQTVLAQPLLFGLVGLAIGVPQWLLLRRYFRNAGLWLPAVAFGFLSFLWLVANPASSLVGFVVVGAILGALAGVLPGAALAWMLQRPRETAR